MTNILVHALGANTGGAVSHLTGLIEALNSSGSEHTYFFLVQKNVLSFKDGGCVRFIEIEKFTSFYSRFFYDNVKVRNIIKSHAISVIVMFTNLGPLYSGIPSILFQCHAGFYCKNYKKYVSFRKRASLFPRYVISAVSSFFCSKVVTPSFFMNEIVQKSLWFVDRKRFVTIYHGSDINDCQFSISNERIQGQIKCAYTSLLAPHKNYQFIIDVARIAKEKGLDVVFTCTASRSDWPQGYDDLISQIEKFGLSKHVSFVGKLDKEGVNNLYRNSDFLFYPSMSESFGFSMIEAIAHGLPVLASDTNINREMCGAAGAFYSPMAPQEAVELIDRCAQEGVYRKLVAECGRRISAQDWSWSRYLNEFEIVVKDVLGDARLKSDN